MKVELIFHSLLLAVLGTKGYVMECPRGWRRDDSNCLRPLNEALDTDQATKRCRDMLESSLRPGDSVTQSVRALPVDLNEKDVNIRASSVLNFSQAVGPVQGTWKRYVCIFSLLEQCKGVLILRSKSDVMAEYQNPIPLLAAPRITVQPADMVYLSEAPTIRLRCVAEQSSLVKSEIAYTWYRGSDEISVDSKRRARVRQIKGDLLIQNATKADTGSYFCKVSNDYGTLISRKAHIRLAYVHHFPTTRLDVFAFEGKGKQVPCLAPNHNPAVASYAWLKNSSKVFVPESERIFIGKDGTLFFSYFKKSDQGRYACSLFITELQSGHYGPFFRLRLKSDDNSDVLRDFKPVFPAEMPRVWRPKSALSGGHLVLECFAYGRPYPNYRWTRVDQQMNMSSVRLENFNRELHIPRADVHHSGIYQCTAENRIGVSVKEVNLQVFAAPEIDATHSGDHVKREGDVLRLSCSADGSPPAQYEWFKNGALLNPLLLDTEQRSRLKISGHRLQIKYLHQNDSGVYQCMAYNQFGHDLLTVEVYVQPRHDSIKWKRVEKEFHALEGSDAKLSCGNYNGKWPSHGIWEMNHTSNSQFELSKFGDSLNLKNLSRRDANGMFKCRINYRNAGIIEHIKLVIYYDINMSVEPNNTHKFIGDELKLTCRFSWSTNAPDSMHTPTWWSYNGFPVERLRQFHTSQIIEFSKHVRLLLVPITSSLHEGNYTCHVPILPSCIIASTAHVAIEGPPLAPVNLTGVAQAVNRILLTWRMPPRQSAKALPVSFFKIELKASYSDRWEVVRDDIPGDVFDYVLNSRWILPFNRYRCRIRALNRLGWSEPSQPTDWVETPAGPPQLIENLTLKTEVLDAGRVLVSWTPLQPHQWGDTSIGYLIEWRPVGEFLKTQTLRLTSSGKRSAEASTYVVETKETIPCKKYEIFIRPYNKYGQGPNSLPIYATPILRAPSNNYDIDATAKNATCASLQLSKSVKVDPCEEIQRFEVVFQHSADENRTTTLDIPFQKIAAGALVCNLSAETEYTIITLAKNSAGQSATASRNRIRTKRPAPVEMPTCCIVSAPDEIGFVLLGWSIDVQALRREDIMGYEVMIRRQDNNVEVKRFNLPLAAGVNFPPKMRIGPVNEETPYLVSVRAYNAGGFGPSSKTVVVMPAATRHYSRAFKHNLYTALILFCVLFIHFFG